MPRQQIREIMDELNTLGGMTPAHMVLITELVAVCLAAGPKPVAVPMSGAERTRKWRESKNGLQDVTKSDDVTSHVTDHCIEDNINKPLYTAPCDAKRHKTSHGTRLPDDWSPSEALWAWGKEKLSPDVLRFETAAFKDFWAAKPGSAGKKLDWDKTWRTWIREAVRRRDRFKPKIVEHQVTGPKRSWAEIKAEKEQSK